MRTVVILFSLTPLPLCHSRYNKHCEEHSNDTMNRTALTKSKMMGQVFTPSHITQFMLDNLGYTANPHILTSTIYEPSFGQGVFLFEIVDRLITAAIEQDIPAATISTILNENVHGVEYDEELFNQTVLQLTTHVEAKGVPSPSWDHLINADALGHIPTEPYDYIVGNPPYIRTHNLTSEMRANVDRFSLTSTGTPDMYVTFIEYGLSVLKVNGKLSYIIPNSWLKNTSQKGLREHLFAAGLIRSIHDYGSEKVFSTVGTYTAIVVLTKNNTHLSYSQKEGGEWVSSSIPYEELSEGDTWLFQSPSNQALLRTNKTRTTTLGDICLVQNALMTMRNAIYLTATDVEEDILYDAVKASTFKGGTARDRILFPYKQENGRVTPYTEQELATQYPKAYAYLNSHKEELLTRKRDASAAWFQYGRSQGVALLPTRRKIVFRHHLSENTTKMDVHILPADTLVYAGWFIMEKEGSSHSLEDIKTIMESEEFCTIMRLLGKDMSSGYKELYSKHIKSFGIPS